jgi:hypothetical protein
LGYGELGEREPRSHSYDNFRPHSDPLETAVHD